MTLTLLSLSCSSHRDSIEGHTLAVQEYRRRTRKSYSPPGQI